MRIALDAMGGDFAPREAVLGGLQAAEARPDNIVALVGDRAAIEKELAAASSVPSNIEIVHASQVVGMDEKPVDAIRKKPDNSILVGMKMVATKKADATISAGNTGAMAAAATILLKPLPGVRRVGIAVSAPSTTGHCILIDVGANLNCKPTHLCQYGVMGSILSKALYDIEKPRVGIISIGEEDTKGNSLVKDASALLAQMPINFRGNAEGRDIFNGNFDVVVCDGFTGNAVLKAIEGYGEMLADVLRKAIFRDVWGRLSFNLMRPVLLNLERRVDFAEYGGGLLAGVDGGVIILHGRSNAKAVATGILRAMDVVRTDVNGSIAAALKDMPGASDKE